GGGGTGCRAAAGGTYQRFWGAPVGQAGPASPVSPRAVGGPTPVGRRQRRTPCPGRIRGAGGRVATLLPERPRRGRLLHAASSAPCLPPGPHLFQTATPPGTTQSVRRSQSPPAPPPKPSRHHPGAPERPPAAPPRPPAHPP